MQMQLASSAAFPEPLLAAMPQLKEKPHMGVPSKNPALYQGHEVCNSTTALGLQAALHLERIRSRYTGKERDTESGNDYFEARYFGSSMGRFLSPDGPFDGSSPDDPQSWNLYSYVQNNPLIGVDPDGHDCVLQTRTDANHETVSSTPGNCDNVSVKDGQSATYVNGNVTGWQAGSDGHSLDIGFNSYDGNSSGTQNAASAPYPDQPNLDMNWGNNSNAGVFVGAYKTVNYATIAVGVTFGSLGGAIAVTDALAGGGASLAGVGRSGASVANKLWHIFGNPDHGLGPLVQKFGGPAAAYEAIQKAAQSQISMTGAFKAVWIQVGGMNLQVNGTVIDGIVKISTAYVPH
jgi:RHS repeat-associated protein